MKYLIRWVKKCPGVGGFEEDENTADLTETL